MRYLTLGEVVELRHVTAGGGKQNQRLIAPVRKEVLEEGGGSVYIHAVLHSVTARWGAMAGLPRFASPVAQERRAYFRALQQWFQTGSGPPVQAPDDPLRPYREAHPRRRRKLISLRVDEHRLELTQEVARQHGLRYQAVIRLWIEEGLRRAIREGVEDPDPSPVVPRS